MVSEEKPDGILIFANAMCPAWVGKELALYCHLVMQAHYPLNFYLIGLLKVQQSYHYTIYDIRPPQAVSREERAGDFYTSSKMPWALR